MNFEDVRKLAITALFSDDVLFDQLVLKGGNAMSLVLHISPRVSLDLDFSMENDFDDLDAIRNRIEKALTARFRTVGLVPFDVELVPKPSTPSALPWWGGYELYFKLIDQTRHRGYGSDRDRLRREALIVSPNQVKTFKVDFSKCEYTEGKVSTDLDDFKIYVYPPSMIAVEKLRALCQQMEQYGPTGRTKRPRARDFFDIYTIMTKIGFRFDSHEGRTLIEAVFAAKEVPIALLSNLAEQRDFHRDDWPNVRATVAEELQEFDYYFDFVLDAIEPLKPFGVV